MKRLGISILFLIIVIFSMSAVCATNETALDDESADINPVDTISADYPVNNISNNSYSISFNVSNVTYASSTLQEDSQPIYSPVLNISLKSDDEGLMDNYVDVQMNYGDYYVDANTKNPYYFSLNQGFNNSIVKNNDFSLLNIIISSRNNNLFLNVVFLNQTSEEFEFTMFDYAKNLLNMLLSSINSLFQ